MPVHDWTRVEAGIFHHFHLSWISSISDTLNAGLLPGDYYALAEQFAGGFGPDVLKLQGVGGAPEEPRRPSPTDGGLMLAPPRARITAETEMEFYRRKPKVIAIRHVSGDDVVAVIEIVSPGNKSGRKAFQAFLDKAADLLDRRINLLILDILPRGPRDPQGIHHAIWEELTGEPFPTPANQPLTLAAYDSSLTLRGYIEPLAVGDMLPDMPLFLEYGAYVNVPLKATYQSAFDAVPRRWRRVLE
jgi:hypothetical protein